VRRVVQLRGVKKLQKPDDKTTTMKQLLGALALLLLVSLYLWNDGHSKLYRQYKDYTSLKLGHAEFLALAPIASRLEKLTALELHLNGDPERIPTELGEFVSLKSLRVLRETKPTRLWVLPRVITRLKALEHLEIQGIPLETLPNTLTSLEQLKTLIIKNCGLQTSVAVVGGMPTLEHIDFSNNRLRYLPQSLY